MPLRINEKFPHGTDEKKLRKKMARNGHYQKVRRPTGLEVYNDAARILDELLAARLDEDMRGPRQVRRNKTDPTANRVSIDTDEKPNVARSKTMPSKYREHKDGITKTPSPTKVKVEDDGSLSSMDTEEEDVSKTSKRRKKSLFKRTTERLMQTFQRDKKTKKDREGDESHGRSESPSKRRKVKRPKGGLVSQSNRHISAHIHEDRSLDYNEKLDIKDRKGSSRTEVHTHKDRISSISSLINPFRKTKKEPPPPPPPAARSSPSPGADYDYECEKEVIYGSIIRKEGGDGPHRPESHRPPPPRDLSNIKRPSVPGSGRRSASSSPVNEYGGAVRQDGGVVLEGNTVRTPGVASSSSTTFPPSEPSWGSGSLVQGGQSSILDSPGEDIAYMDTDLPADSTVTLQGNSILPFSAAGPARFHDSVGLMNFKWLKDADSANKMDMEIDEQIVSMQREDGAIETTTTITATRTVVMPGVPEEDEFDCIDGATGGENGATGGEAIADRGENGQNKDEIYGKIAQRLIEMADNFNAAGSDSEIQGEADAEPTPLTELEQKIIDCLRSGGDKHNNKIEKRMDEMKTEAQQDAYGRFKNTVQHSMGSDMSWDLLAMLFYTTKGVVSAVGKGTQTATQAKEFTLQYFSDTYANWIVEQGGFDSMLSSGESDYDVD